jgi:predicted nucleic acid-binding protein
VHPRRKWRLRAGRGGRLSKPRRLTPRVPRSTTQDGPRPIAEYRVGIELADSAERAAARARALTAIESVVDVLAYTDTTAAHHARLIAHVRRTGAPLGAHNLIIAAHAAETGRTVLTRDVKAGFAGLPGVLAIDTP